MTKELTAISYANGKLRGASASDSERHHDAAQADLLRRAIVVLADQIVRDETQHESKSIIDACSVQTK